MSTSKKLRWGVIGCGGIAKRTSLPRLIAAESAELVAVQDINPAAVEDVRATFGVKHGTTSAEELLALPDVDAVYIATPLFCHREQVLLAAKYKKHVLCEKPLGLCGDEVAEMVDACRKAGVAFGAAFMARFHDLHVKAKGLIEAGALGEIVSVKACWSFDYPKSSSAWRQKKELGGGGAFMDVGTHCLDIVRFMTGLEVTEVVALCGNQFYDYTVEDYGQMLCRLSNGATLYLSNNYNISTEPQRVEICGRKAALFIHDTMVQDGKLYMTQSKRSEPVDITPAGPRTNAYTAEFEGFSRAVLDGTPLPVPAEEGLVAQRIIDAAYQSNATGQRTKV